MVGSTIAQPWYRIPRIELSGIPFWHRPAVLAAIGMLISRTLKFGGYGTTCMIVATVCI
jgi:hypothetical protein